MSKPFSRNFSTGFTMLEILVTLFVLAFGMLGLAAMQGKMHMSGAESYQRSQAYLLLQDMVNRMQANSGNAAAYVTGTDLPIGTGDGRPADCSTVAIGAARDQCEWSNALKGAAEEVAGKNTGAMLGARGCVELVQAPNAAPGICTPGTYRVSVVWQGLNKTGASTMACAQKANYGGNEYRRVISAVFSVGLFNC